MERDLRKDEHLTLEIAPEPDGGWPWAKAYASGMSCNATIPSISVPEILAIAAEKWPDRTAIEFRGRNISYQELLSKARGMAATLIADGTTKGDRIALLLPNTPAHPVVFFGALLAGAVVVHLSPMDAPPVLAHKIKDSGAELLVSTNVGALAGEATKLGEAGLVDRVAIIDDSQWGESPDTGPIPMGTNTIILEMGNGELKARTALPADLALLQYTGGTTGLPKAAKLTHRNLVAAVTSYDLWYKGWEIDADNPDRILLYLPLFHIYGLSAVLLRSLCSGNTILLRTRFDAVSALDEIEAGVTVFPGVPTMWIAICQTPDFEKRDLSTLRFAASGGAPMPVEIARRFTTRTGLELLGGWGMSETAPAGTNLPRGHRNKAGTIGIPLPGVYLRVVALDDPGRVLQAGETGELAVCGANVTSGYWNRPDENKKSFAHGWFLTGDIGFVDEDGFFTIVDRKKDMIISGGFNVYPQMIEQAIYEHDDVEEVLVIGVADGYRGEAAKAFIKLRAGAPDLTLDSLHSFLKDRVGRHEMPAALELRDALPRTPVGKLSKVELKQEEANRSRRAAS